MEDHGAVRGDTIRTAYPEAQQVLGDLAEAGIDYDNVVTVLEADGVARFEDPWTRVASQLSQRMRADSDTPDDRARFLLPHPVHQEVHSR